MNVKRFIFVSTQSVYGISKLKTKTVTENYKNVKPITQYAKSKLRAEKDILKLADKTFLCCNFKAINSTWTIG